MINSLQSLRGIFAILVFLSHFAINEAGDRVFYVGGPIGVEFFMMLSGFVLCSAYQRKAADSQLDYKRFEIKRILRIYPLHLACLAAWIIVNAGFAKYDFASFVSNVLLLQAWSTDVHVFYSYNIPSWYLSALLFFYLLFPVLLHVAVKYTKAFFSGYAFVVVGYLCFLYFVADTLPGDLPLWTTRIFPVTRLIDFVAGMFLWHCYTKILQTQFHKRLVNSSLLHKTTLELFPIFLYIIAVNISGEVSYTWQSQAIWWLPTICGIMIYAIHDKRGGLLTRLLDNKWLVTFGNASFAFYLLHTAVIGAIGRTLHFVGLEVDTDVRFWVSLAASIVVSLLVTKYFDNPIVSKLKHYFLRPSSAK